MLANTNSHTREKRDLKGIPSELGNLYAVDEKISPIDQRSQSHTQDEIGSAFRAAEIFTSTIYLKRSSPPTQLATYHGREALKKLDSYKRPKLPIFSPFSYLKK